MKFLPKFMMLILAVAPIVAQEVDRKSATSFTTARLEIVGAAHARPADEQRNLTIKFWLQQLMLSALYRDVVQESSLEEWQQHSSALLRIQCRYPSSATLALPERRVLVFDEVLLPLSEQRYPDYIFIKQGQRVLRLAKYDPWVLHKLVSESGFSLYPSLATIERFLF